MEYDREIHHRRSIRLDKYDYSLPGAYFVTICSEKHACLFGDIAAGEMVLNEAGKMIGRWWLELGNKYPTAGLDKYSLMPNHLHGIIMISRGIGSRAAARRVISNGNEKRKEADSAPVIGTCEKTGRPRRAAPTLGDMIGWFKTMTTIEYIHNVKEYGWSPFRGRLWQRGYYEHIIRNEESYKDVWTYIDKNPANWADDEDNPVRIKEKQLKK